MLVVNMWWMIKSQEHDLLAVSVALEELRGWDQVSVHSNELLKQDSVFSVNLQTGN